MARKGKNGLLNSCSENFCSTYTKWKQRTEYEEVPDIEQNYLNEGNIDDDTERVMIKIDCPVPLRDEPRFPKEKWKTFMAFLILGGNFIISTTSLSLVHDRLPDRDIYDPLPDIFLDNVDSVEWALNVSEIMIMVVIYFCFGVILLHKHRFIVLRRMFLLMSALYFMRSITMYVTVLPVPSKTYYCSPKSNLTSPLMIAKRSIQLLSGLGMSINGKHTFCGDYIYSGHTVMLVLGYLIISEYLPKRLFIIHWLAWLNALVGVIMVLLAHGHYCIDVIIAYYVTTRLFWSYHTLANNSFLQNSTHNYYAKEWWFPVFKYFEQNVRGPVPRQFEWIFPWPRCLQPKSPNWES